MKKRKKIRYSNESIGKVKIIADFLPSLDELVMKEEATDIVIFDHSKQNLDSSE